MVSIYFAQDFAIGDDARDECRALGDCFGRTPSAIDRQWRNLDAVYHGKHNFNVGKLVKQTLEDYLANPAGVKKIALDYCDTFGWPVKELILSQVQNLPVPRKASQVSESSEVKREFFLLLEHLQYKLFSSGSQGYYVQGKLSLRGGKKFQAQATAILIGSKANLAVSIHATRAQMVAEMESKLDFLKPKNFSTGRVGYYGNLKIQIGSERFQVAIMAVEIRQKAN